MEQAISEEWRGGRSEASIPNDAWKPRAPVGLHSQDLFDHNRPIVSHNSRCRNSGFCPSDRSLLRQQWGRPRSLHRNHHHSLHRYVLLLLFQLFCFSIFSLEVLLIFDYDFFFFFWGLVLVLCPLFYYHQKHPVNYVLLGIFTVSLAFAVGLTCAFTSGK